MEGFLSSQTLQLCFTEVARALIKHLGPPSRPISESQICGSEKYAVQTSHPPITRNMHPGYHQGRSTARCQCLHQCHHSESGVVYRDAAELDHKADMTAVITDEYEANKNSCSITGTIREEAGEVAIALAIARPTSATLPAGVPPQVYVAF